MFYEPGKTSHHLPHDPFKACIVPRPIGWISSQNKEGDINLAPYSFFNAVSDHPPMVLFSSTNFHHEDRGFKDTLKNIEETGEFVVNIATYELHQQVNLTSALLSRKENEFAFANLEMSDSTLVKPPRVKASPIHLECRYYQSIQLPVLRDQDCNRIVIGEVIGIYIDESILTNGLIDIHKLKPIARLGYMDYAVIDKSFTLQRP